MKMNCYCLDCHNDVTVPIGSEEEYDGAPEIVSCPMCGGAAKVLGVLFGYDFGYERRRFPYYDESLDRHIESPQHKRTVLKEMNLVQHDGFFTSGGVKKSKKGVVYSFGGK